MNLTVNFSAERWAVQVRTMIEELRVQAKDFLKQELGLLLGKIIAFTPPHSKSEGGGAVQSDIRKLVQPFAVDTFKDKRLAEIVQSKDYGAFSAFCANSKNSALQNATAIDAYTVPDLHARYRNARGRVNPGVHLKNFVLGVTDRRFLREYTKRKVDNVGMARSGWLAALSAVGGAMATVETVGWVSRHGSEFGSFQSALDDPDKPSLTAINSTPWARRKDEASRIVRAAQDSRTNALKGRMKFIMGYVLEKGGMRRAA